jgi:cytochrome c peroxidase
MHRSGEGEARLAYGKGILVQRNAFSLMGRGAPGFTTFFWDGRVEQQDDTLINPLGEKKSELFRSPLAVAAVLPLLERDEFLGRTGLFRNNEIHEAVGQKLYNNRYLAVSEALRKRFLVSSNTEDVKVVQALRSVGVDLRRFELAHVSNLIAIHIANKFRCKASRWDRYLQGEKTALSITEKEGALLFYGKGRCAACHSGPMMSDFKFHSIGTPQGRFGPHSRHRDIGRAHVTTRVEDLYKFRTPPLMEVRRTKPYGHNGVFETTRDVVVHHFNPLEFYRQKADLAIADYYEVGKLVAARDAVLGTIEISHAEELQAVLAFLDTI